MAAQTVYNINAVAAVPGMIADGDLESAVIEGRYAAAGNIPFGSAVEVYNGKVQVMQQTGSTVSNMLGVAIYQGMREQAYPAQSTAINAGYAAGDMVPVLRSGRIYALWDTGASAPVGFGTLNIQHSSDGTHNQGVFTSAGTSAGAGTECTAAPATCSLAADQTGQAGVALPTNVCLLEISMP